MSKGYLDILMYFRFYSFMFWDIYIDVKKISIQSTYQHPIQKRSNQTRRFVSKTCPILLRVDPSILVSLRYNKKVQIEGEKDAEEKKKERDRSIEMLYMTRHVEKGIIK